MNYLHSYHTVTDTGKNQRAKIFPQILVVSLSIRDEHPGFAYDQTQDDYVTIDLHMSL
jgi:hypothetical protein